MGEFGRTPNINARRNPGRQHWPRAISAIAGGGIRGGMVYGESDKIGAYVKDKPVRPQDLGATIYHALDVPLDACRWARTVLPGRPRRATRCWSCLTT